MKWSTLAAKLGFLTVVTTHVSVIDLPQIDATWLELNLTASFYFLLEFSGW